MFRVIERETAVMLVESAKLSSDTCACISVAGAAVAPAVPLTVSDHCRQCRRADRKPVSLSMRASVSREMLTHLPNVLY